MSATIEHSIFCLVMHGDNKMLDPAINAYIEHKKAENTSYNNNLYVQDLIKYINNIKH